jgi:hypothetical protein
MNEAAEKFLGGLGAAERVYLENILKQLRQCKEFYPWQFVKPLPKQAQFLRYVGERNQVVLFQGGNWTGKTLIGANAALQIAFTGGITVGGTFYKMCGVPNMGRIATKKENVEKDVNRILANQLHRDTYNTEKKGRPFDSQWTVEGGSTFDIMTYDQDAEQFEGVELNWAWLNEPSTEAIYKAMLGRFKKGGTLFITATILNCGWILDEIIENDDCRIKTVTMDIDENRESRGGYIPDQAIDDMLARQDPEEREARKSGKALKLMGRVFKNYRPEVHWVELSETAPAGARVVMATDPHDRIPHASLWAYKKDGVVCVYREHPVSDFWEYSTNPWADEADLVKEYKAVEDVAPSVRLLDKKFGNTAKFGSKLTVNERMREAGLVYDDWDGSSRAAHNSRLRGYFEQNKVAVGRNCVNLHKSLMRHRFLDQTSGRAKDDKGLREDVDEKYRHFIDCLAAIIEWFEVCENGGELIDFRRGVDDWSPLDTMRQAHHSGTDQKRKDEIIWAERQNDEDDGFFVL